MPSKAYSQLMASKPSKSKTIYKRYDEGDDKKKKKKKPTEAEIRAGHISRAKQPTKGIKISEETYKPGSAKEGKTMPPAKKGEEYAPGKQYGKEWQQPTGGRISKSAYQRKKMAATIGPAPKALDVSKGKWYYDRKTGKFQKEYGTAYGRQYIDYKVVGHKRLTSPEEGKKIMKEAGVKKPHEVAGKTDKEFTEAYKGRNTKTQTRKYIENQESAVFEKKGGKWRKKRKPRRHPRY